MATPTEEINDRLIALEKAVNDINLSVGELRGRVAALEHNRSNPGSRANAEIVRWLIYLGVVVASVLASLLGVRVWYP